MLNKSISFVPVKSIVPDEIKSVFDLNTLFAFVRCHCGVDGSDPRFRFCAPGDLDMAEEVDQEDNVRAMLAGNQAVKVTSHWVLTDGRWLTITSKIDIAEGGIVTEYSGGEKE